MFHKKYISTIFELIFVFHRIKIKIVTKAKKDNFTKAPGILL